MLRRSGQVMMIAIAVILILTACESGAGHGIAALSRTSENTMRLTICTPIDATKLSFSVRDLAVDKDWIVVAEYEGHHQFARRESIDLGAPVSGMRLTQSAETLVKDGQEYDLFLNGNPDVTVYWKAADWAGVGSGWLQVNHSMNQPAVTAAACP